MSLIDTNGIGFSLRWGKNNKRWDYQRLRFCGNDSDDFLILLGRRRWAAQDIGEHTALFG